MRADRLLHIGLLLDPYGAAPCAGDGQVGVDDQDGDERGAARIVEAAQARLEPADVVVDDAWRCFLAAAVEDDER